MPPPSVITVPSSPPQLIAIAVLEHEGRVLIGQRPAGVPLAGCWEFPGGKVRAEETPAAAAVRECREETGLDVAVRGMLAEVEHEYPHGRLRLCFFSAVAVNTRTPPLPPFRWVAITSLASYTFPPANQAILEILQNRCTIFQDRAS